MMTVELSDDQEEIGISITFMLQNASQSNFANSLRYFSNFPI